MVSSDTRHRCMMDISQSAVACYPIMYQDWCLSVSQRWTKILRLSQMTALSKIVVSMDTSACLKALITCFLAFASSVHVWQKTRPYPHINSDGMQSLFIMIDFGKIDGVDWRSCTQRNKRISCRVQEFSRRRSIRSSKVGRKNNRILHSRFYL